MTDLKPCPFCGSAPTAIPGGKFSSSVECRVCENAATLCNTIDEAIHDWNTRAALSPAPLSEADEFAVGMQLVTTALGSGKRSDGPGDFARMLQADLDKLGLAIVRVRP